MEALLVPTFGDIVVVVATKVEFVAANTFVRGILSEVPVDSKAFSDVVGPGFLTVVESWSSSESVVATVDDCVLKSSEAEGIVLDCLPCTVALVSTNVAGS